jgi:hypothetical protein
MWTVLEVSEPEGRDEEYQDASKQLTSATDVMMGLETASPLVRMEAFKTLMDVLVMATRVQTVEFSISGAIKKVLTWFDRELQSEGYGNANELFYIKAITHAVLGGGLPHDDIAPAVVAHYVKHNKECETHIKAFMQSLKKKLAKQGVWPVELGAMEYLFTQFLKKDEQEIYSDLQALVEKVAQAHPPMMRDRSALKSIIKDGISYALDEAPSKVLFLDVAIKTLSSKLSAQDKAEIEHELNRKMQNETLVADADDEDWIGYFDLKSELQGSTSRSRNTKKKATGGRQAMHDSMSLGDDLGDDDDDDDDDLDENDMDSEEEEVASSRNSSSSGRGSKRRSFEAMDDEDDEEDEGEGDGEDEEKENADEDEADLSASSGFKPKLRAQETSIPGRGSGASHRNKRRR